MSKGKNAMTHKDPQLDHQIENMLDRWDEVRNETEQKIRLGRLEMDHLKLVDKIEEELVDIVNKDSRYHGDVQTACNEAEHLRTRVRRRLMKQGTATEIPIASILPA